MSRKPDIDTGPTAQGQAAPVDLLARPAARWAVVVGTGLALTLAVAAVAAARADDRPWLTFVVFALATGPAFLGGAWVLVPNPSDPASGVRTEDTVEHDWSQRAGFGAFVDLVVAMGLTTAAHEVAGTPAVPVLALLVLGLVDFALRYAVHARRSS